MKTADDIFKDGPLIRLVEHPVLTQTLADVLDFIPLSAWPMQHATCCRPAMVNEPTWPKIPGVLTLAEMTKLLVGNCAHGGLWAHTGQSVVDLDFRTPMLSVVMPNQDVAAHGDRQEESWLGRLHLPIMTNPHAEFTLAGKAYHLERSVTYLLDVRQVHSSINRGLSTRVHLMVDVHRRQP